MDDPSQKLTRQQRRTARRPAIPAARNADSPEDSIVAAETILRDEYGFVEAILLALLVEFIKWIIPIIWNWIKSGRSDREIMLELESVDPDD